jgi:4-amino-4-deoxy-L-arabinose transferase-like glycosyltransferase
MGSDVKKMKAKNVWKILKENKEIVGIVIILGGYSGFVLGVFESMILISVGVISVIIYSVISRKIGSYKTAMIFIAFLAVFAILEIIYSEQIIAQIDNELAACLVLSLCIVMIVILGIRIKEEIIRVKQERNKDIE